VIEAALLLMLAADAITPPPAALVAVPSRFAPPFGQPMTYRVTTRRLSRDGSMASYTLVYALQWDRVGRGVQLRVVLQRVESDARPELADRVAGMLQPLVGHEVTYLVAPDGSRVDLVDPEELWQRLLGETYDLGVGSDQPQARQMANILAALPPDERDRLVTSDIRALVAAANSIPRIPSADVSIRQEGGLQTIVRREESDTADGATQPPLAAETSWTIDTATGLVLTERRQSFAVAGGKKRLVDERIRTLDIFTPD
jgi:hypothetical protein